MYSTPVGYQQPAHQQYYSQGHQNPGPPPAKRPKGNPIITRYPPPPGYKGPAQPQVPAQPPAWSQPSQPYGYGQPSYGAYPSQPYNAPQNYQQHQWPGYQQQPYPPPNYQVQPTYYPGPAPPTVWQHPTSAPQSAPPQSWQYPGSASQQPPRRHHSAPFAFSVTKPSGIVDGNGDPYPAQQPTTGTDNDLEDDFDGECYFARRPDEIDPVFSLGVIEWQAPLPTRRALPSTFQEAELEALAPRQLHAADDESISEFFTNSKRDEVFLSIRQTEEWEHVKDDLIFRELPRSTSHIISMAELTERYRNRPDPAWMEQRRMQSESQTPSSSRAPTPARYEQYDHNMDIDGRVSSNGKDEHGDTNHNDFLDDLEQALLPDTKTNRLSGDSCTSEGYHSRTASISSQTTGNLTRPKPVLPVRDPAQEDILAALGVTGSPKKFYQTPGPVRGPPPRESTSRHSSVTSIPGRDRVPPPPPPPASRDARMYNDHYPQNGHNGDRPGSSASQHTASGSDFHADDNDTTPRPRLDRIDSRKRAYDESDEAFYGAGSQHDNDATPKQRRKQARVDRGGSYSRRW